MSQLANQQVLFFFFPIVYVDMSKLWRFLTFRRKKQSKLINKDDAHGNKDTLPCTIQLLDGAELSIVLPVCCFIYFANFSNFIFL